MNLDITFCHPKLCEKENGCARWVKNLIDEAGSHGIDISERRISVSDFSKNKEPCHMFISKEDKK